MRRRKLLLHRAEIDKLLHETRERGLTLVPTKLYLKNGLIKVELAVGNGKKLHDKRESEREREMEAEAKAAVGRRQKNSGKDDKYGNQTFYQAFDRVQADAIAVAVFRKRPRPPELAPSRGVAGGTANASGEFSGKPGELAVLHQPRVRLVAAKRLAVVGRGQASRSIRPALRKAVGATVAIAQTERREDAGLVAGTGDAAEAAVEGAILGNFEPDRHKTSSKESKSLEAFLLAVAAANGAEIASCLRARQASWRMRRTSRAIWRTSPPT